MICDICEEREAVSLVGNLQTGAQLALCSSDAARWGLELAKALLPPEEIAAALDGMFVNPSPQPAETAPKAPKSEAGTHTRGKAVKRPKVAETLEAGSTAAKDG